MRLMHFDKSYHAIDRATDLHPNDRHFAEKLVATAKKNGASTADRQETIDSNILLTVLKRNKVPLVYLDRGLFDGHSDFFKTPEFNKQFELETAECHMLREEWAKVKDEFTKADIESILIKSVGYFPYKSSNLDVLIKQSKRDKAESILIQMGYIQLHNVEEPFKTLFRKFKGLASVSVIHLHNKVAWMNPFHDEELLWARYRKSDKDDLLDIPSAEDSILILTAHWFYEDKEIKLSDILKVTTCLKNNVDWRYLTSVAKKMGWLNGLYFGLLVQAFIEKHLYGKSFIQDKHLEEFHLALPRWMRVYLEKKVYSREILLPFKLPKILGKSLHLFKTCKDNTTTVSRKITELYRVANGALFAILFYKFKVNIRYQPPMLISISGIDGSGKSTYAEHLCDILNLCEIRTRTVWSRIGSSSFLKPFSKIAKIFYYFKKRKGFSDYSENAGEAEMRRKDLFEKSPVFRWVGISLLLIEMLWHYSYKVALPLVFKNVVICDRYVYDSLVDIKTRYGINSNSREGRFFKEILTTLTPKADIAFVLNIPLAEACNQEKVNLQESGLIEDQMNAYQDIAKLFDLNQVNTDSHTPIGDICDRMINETLIAYYKKWPTPKNQTESKAVPI